MHDFSEGFQKLVGTQLFVAIALSDFPLPGFPYLVHILMLLQLKLPI
jgi:hypothetical protein